MSRWNGCGSLHIHPGTGRLGLFWYFLNLQQHLASLNIVHRDLACRNVLIGANKHLKITDFGLSREVEEVYEVKGKNKLPWRWMAIESLERRIFTTYSDVWSFGITLWEISTFGK